ncbi:Putative LOC100169340 [Caligus rogercresseyi]|uniref:LOC100169340 n=1 Tax=Caligus rogercresseyi TaxID=217165 RepID=A0A7T8GYP3_CALRO|nr:Putative LOC100169340 [Caligus rogercresseyi]
MEACRDLCLAAPYRCHSFDYGDTGDRVCRLSHHTSNTLLQIKRVSSEPKFDKSKRLILGKEMIEPYLVIDDIVGTYELSSCYNVTIDCRASNMIATVRTNKIFNGKIYAKDNPNSCVVDVQNGIEFSIKMDYNDIECNVKRESDGVYANEVIIQHHDRIVTSSDLGLASTANTI